jgi:hypothetical protein
MGSLSTIPVRPSRGRERSGEFDTDLGAEVRSAVFDPRIAVANASAEPPASRAQAPMTTNADRDALTILGISVTKTATLSPLGGHRRRQRRFVALPATPP